MPSLLVEFRKRLSEDVLNEINGLYLLHTECTWRCDESDGFPESAKFKSGRIAKIGDITAYNYRFRLQIEFTHWVKLQAVILLPINDVISMHFSHFC